MICLACGAAAPARGALCGPCAAGLAAGGARRVAGGVLVQSAFAHQGTARLLVHRLKYRGHPAAAGLLASSMVGGLPAGARCLIPVPRARLRLWRYGVDPALELARALGRATGLPVARVLVASWWHRRRAGVGGARRGVPCYRARGVAPPGAVLVDDVVTTGATLAAAAAALGRLCPALTATSALCPVALPGAEAVGIVIAKPPLGGADHGSVRAARSAPSQRSLSFSVCPPFPARAGRWPRRSRWRFVSTVSA